MELYLVSIKGEIISNLGVLMERSPLEGATSSEESQQTSLPAWLRQQLDSIKDSHEWKSIRGPDPREEYWCMYLSRENAEFFLIMKDWIPTSKLVSGPSSLATIIHDLKNPIGAIYGYSDAMLDTNLGKGLAPNHLSVLSRIRKASVRSLDLLKNYESLLYVGRRKQPKITDLNEVVRLVIDTSFIEEERYTIELLLEDSALHVAIPRFCVDRIVSNLVGNAVKYTPPEGTIFVQTKRSKGNAILQVRNTEPLLTEGERDKIFEARSRGSTAGDVAGTGMGLYTVRVLAESAGGAASLFIDPKLGNTFEIVLPVTAKAEAPSSTGILP